jgi:predicted nucleic acid-binding protein
VIPPDEPIVLDTNVLLQLLRGRDVGTWLDATYGLRARPIRPFVPEVVVGELLSFAIRRRYGQERLARLHELLAALVPVEVNRVIAERYAAILAASQAIGRPIGENDTWIAATAAVLDATILTIDPDFDRLPPGLVKVERARPPKAPRRPDPPGRPRPTEGGNADAEDDPGPDDRPGGRDGPA